MKHILEQNNMINACLQQMFLNINQLYFMNSSLSSEGLSNNSQYQETQEEEIQEETQEEEDEINIIL